MATESKRAASDYLALCLLAISVVPIHGLMTLLTQTEETFRQIDAPFTLSIFFAFAAPISIYLITRYARISNIGDIFGLFLLFFALYLFSSILPALLAGEIQAADVVIARFYLSTIIFTTAIYFWAAQLSDAALANVLRITKGLFVIACLGTIFTQQFGFYQERTGIERLAGLFFDQNQAAFVALYCLVLVAAYPANSRLLTLAQGGIAFTALVLTFSRTGLLTFLLLSFLFLFNRPSVKTVAFFIIGMTVLTWALWMVFEHDLMGLSWAQRARLADVLDIATGQVSEGTMGERAILFDVGARKIAEVFPWGAGINKFHSLEYGIRSYSSGAWLGVHNTYLMILGEAGLAALVAFLAFWTRTIWKLANSSSAFRIFSIGASVVLLCSMLTTHSVLSQKVPPAMLAFVMVIAARAPAFRKTFTAPRNTPGGFQA